MLSSEPEHPPTRKPGDLACAYPVSGGLQVYVQRALGDLAGTVASFLYWSACIAAAAGFVNALFVGSFPLQAAAACVLVVTPFTLLMLALAHPGHVRLIHREGTAYPDGFSGFFWGSLALGAIALTDPHTLIGEDLYYGAVPLGVGFAGLWLYAEWERLRESLPSWAMPLVILLVGFLSGSWAGGTIYQANTVADLSAPVWGESSVTELRVTRSRAGPNYRVKVAPWSASREPVELDISRETYQSLRTGMRVEIGVRPGLLGIPWVDEVRPKLSPTPSAPNGGT